MLRPLLDECRIGASTCEPGARCRRAAKCAIEVGVPRKSHNWKMPQREWAAAKAQFAILFEDRFAIA